MNDKIAARIFIGLAAFGFASFGPIGCSPEPAKVNRAPEPAVTFKPREMADALHAVIAANHEIHFREVMRTFQAGDAPRRDAFLETHARTLRRAGESIQQKGAEFHYVLRSLWPINPANLPETATEKKGLQFVCTHRDENFYTEESLGGRRYFTAVYPMSATSAECAGCHNRNAASPRKDFKPGEAMGGLIVRVPLEF